jgi:hypothetical protein
MCFVFMRIQNRICHHIFKAHAIVPKMIQGNVKGESAQFIGRKKIACNAGTVRLSAKV